jgi:hypothetical protein
VEILRNSTMIAFIAFHLAARMMVAAFFRRHHLRPVAAAGYTICQAVLSSRTRLSFPAMTL